MKRPANVRRALTDAKGISSGLPDLLVEARRIATTVLAGWHGRRVSGRGETFWLWSDLSPSMDFHSRLSTVTKRQRAIVLLLALAESLSAAGERIGLLGATNTILARNGAERIAASLPDAASMPALPQSHSLKRFSDFALIGDFL